jgi:hypothetical protein
MAISISIDDEDIPQQLRGTRVPFGFAGVKFIFFAQLFSQPKFGLFGIDAVENEFLNSRLLIE